MPLDFPVIGVGVGSGAVERARKFFGALPGNFQMAFLVVAGSDPNDPNLVARLRAALRIDCIVSPREGAPIQRGSVTIVAAGASLELVQGGFVRSVVHTGGARPIDSFFTALAIDQAENAGCVVFCGASGDGASGLRAIKENGGVTVADRPGRGDTALGRAIASGFVDFVLEPEAMAGRLDQYFGDRKRMDPIDQASGFMMNDLSEIRSIVSQATGHALVGYTDASIARRIAHRMAILAISDMHAFLARLQGNPEEARQLFRDVLVSVSNFFREPAAFSTLARNVLPGLFAEKPGGQTVRIWVPACASGEEAYSLAILCAEQSARTPGAPEVEIIATDIKESALALACEACFSASIVRDVSEDRLGRFFVGKGGAYRVAERIRRTCHFSKHDLLRDTPPVALDLISCRNVLVYFRPEAQDHVFAAFHRALRQNGYLFLGAPDAPPRKRSLFVIVDAEHRIFRRA